MQPNRRNDYRDNHRNDYRAEQHAHTYFDSGTYRNACAGTV
jgi:hypothetical protein